MANIKKVKANIFLWLTAIIWGFAFVAQCDAADKIDTFLLMGVRYLLGGISLLPIIFLFENRKEKEQLIPVDMKKTVLYGMLCGTILFTASVLQQYGINLNPNAGKAGFITGTYTVMVPVFCLILFKKKTGINVWLGAVCATVGLYLLSVTNGLSSVAISDIILIIGAVFWTFHIIAIDLCINKVSAIKFSCVQFLTCALLGFAVMLIRSNVSVADMSAQLSGALLPVLYMGIGSSGVAYTCQALGQRDADPTSAAIILSTESVFAAIGGLLFKIDEDMTARKYIGCIIIFIGIVVSQLPKDFLKKKFTRQHQS